MWNAIVNVMTKMFDALHNMIIALGVPEHAEGISYVLAILKQQNRMQKCKKYNQKCKNFKRSMQMTHRSYN